MEVFSHDYSSLLSPVFLVANSPHHFFLALSSFSSCRRAQQPRIQGAAYVSRFHFAMSNAATTTMYSAGDRTPANNTQEDDTQTGDDQMLPTFYCRALYDYQATDGSSLSFYRGDIIEVLTQLESGWWDGLLGEERGWFPSNYVQPISDAEAEAELGIQLRPPEVHDSAIDVSQQVRGPTSPERDRDWMQEEMEYLRNTRHGYQDVNRGAMSSQTASNHDFWLPEVDPTGQVCVPGYESL